MRARGPWTGVQLLCDLSTSELEIREGLAPLSGLIFLAVYVDTALCPNKSKNVDVAGIHEDFGL